MQHYGTSFLLPRGHTQVHTHMHTQTQHTLKAGYALAFGQYAFW